MTQRVSSPPQLTGTGEYHVTRSYDDFEWLQQSLFSQEDVPGIQGVIVSPAFVHSSCLQWVKAMSTGICCFVIIFRCILASVFLLTA